MLEMNKVMLIGNITRDPELTYLTNGNPLAKFGLALNESWKNKQTGEWDKKTCFVDVTAWGKTGEFAAKYLKKGTRIYLEGKLNFSTWETQSGEKRSKLDVTAERIQFAEAKAKDADNAPASTPQQKPDFDAYKRPDENWADDLPF